jgi:possible dehydrogenase
LTRLGVDYLNLYIIHRFDLYIIHRFDYSTPMAETMEALDRLVRDGRARALGASAMYGYQLHNLQRVADENGWTRLSSLQNHYNLLYREDERELIPVVRQYGMSLTPYSPLASGHLTRSTWDSDSVRSTTDGTMRQKYDRDREIDMPIVVLEAFEGRRRRPRVLARALGRGGRLPRGALRRPRPRRTARAPEREGARGDGRSATAGTEERMTTRAQSAAGNEVEDYLASIPPTARPRLDTARPRLDTARPALTGLTLADHANCALRQLGTEPSRAHSDSPSRDSEQTPGRFRTSSHRS